jgi:hypothetical protein
MKRPAPLSRLAWPPDLLAPGPGGNHNASPAANRLADPKLRPACSLPVLKQPTPASGRTPSTKSTAQSPVIAIQEEPS